MLRVGHKTYVKVTKYNCVDAKMVALFFLVWILFKGGRALEI